MTPKPERNAAAFGARRSMIAAAFLFPLLLAAEGCGPAVTVKGGQKHEVNVHHDPQRVDVHIHRDRRRRRN